MVEQIDTLNNRAKGCIIGAFIGDSLGSYLEFMCREFEDRELIAGMEMPGGGPWGLAPGQVTDDSELAMCLMQGLIKGEGKLDVKKIHAMYAQWMDSPPFDIGMTTEETLMCCQLSDDPSRPYRAAKHGGYAAQSESNGSLMRITPMAVWIHKLP